MILSAASRREDRGVELPANVQSKAAGKIIAKLIRADLLEEVRVCGSLPVWRGDDEGGAIALRIMSAGLAVINAADEVIHAPEVNGVRTCEVTRSAQEGITSRKQIFLARQTSVRKRHRPGKAKTGTDRLPDSRPGSKQARVLAMLDRAEGVPPENHIRA